jgi:hypothetical protein
MLESPLARASDTLGSGASLLQLGSGKRPRIQRSGNALTGKSVAAFGHTMASVA